MSPFISNDVIKYFNDRSPYIEHTQHMLITRSMSLSRLKPADCNNFRIFTIKDAVLDGESTLSENEVTQQKKQDIHAKVFMTRKYTDTDLYLGSLNASHNAVFGNVEFMICLHSKNRYLNIDKLTEGLFDGTEGGPNNPFQQVDVNDAVIDEEAEKNSLLDGIIKKINRLNPKATIVESGEFYDVSLYFGNVSEFNNYDISITPLFANKPMALSEEVIFCSLPLTDLSEFYIVSVSDDNHTVSRVIKCCSSF